MRLGSRLPLLALALLLGACTTATLRPDAQLLAAQAQREKQLTALPGWTLEGRLAVSANGEGGSGTLLWQHDAQGYEFQLRAPVTGRSFRLHGTAAGVTLEGLERGAVTGTDASALLRRTLGWRVPVRQLDYWVRGMRAPGGDAVLRFAADGLPASLQQDGWVIEYRDWYADVSPPLPRRVFGRSGDASVKLIINRWNMYRAAAPGSLSDL